MRAGRRRGGAATAVVAERCSQLRGATQKPWTKTIVSGVDMEGFIGRPFVRGVQELEQVGAELLLLVRSRVTLYGVIGGALAGPDSGSVCDTPSYGWPPGLSRVIMRRQHARGPPVIVGVARSW